jgi:hypothetical protein
MEFISQYGLFFDIDSIRGGSPTYTQFVWVWNDTQLEWVWWSSVL